MSRTLDDLINNLNNLETEIKNQLPNITAEYATSAVALAWQRVEKEGAKEGARYSEDPIYATLDVFNRKSAFKPQGKKNNKKAKVIDIRTRKAKQVPVKEDFTERKSMYLEHGYKQLREIQGLLTKVVDLTYSGRMHQNTKVLKVENDGDFKTTAIVGATNEEEKNKLAGNFKRFGNFLGITLEIGKVINPIPANRITGIIKSTLG